MKELTPKEEDQIKKELEKLFNDHIIYTPEERYEENENAINNEHLMARAGENEEDTIFKNKGLEPKNIKKIFINLILKFLEISFILIYL